MVFAAATRRTTDDAMDLVALCNKQPRQIGPILPVIPVDVANLAEATRIPRGRGDRRDRAGCARLVRASATPPGSKRETALSRSPTFPQAKARSPPVARRSPAAAAIPYERRDWPRFAKTRTQAPPAARAAAAWGRRGQRQGRAPPNKIY
jgi:hypothetical protein